MLSLVLQSRESQDVTEKPTEKTHVVLGEGLVAERRVQVVHPPVPALLPDAAGQSQRELAPPRVRLVGV